MTRFSNFYYLWQRKKLLNLKIMENNTKQLIDYIKSVIQTCEDADRKMLTEEKEGYQCKIKEGFSGSFEFDYLDGLYGSKDVSGHFEYYDTGLALDEYEYETEDLPFSSLSFLTKEVYKDEVVPALTSWLGEKVQSEEYGGLYRAEFRLALLIGDKGKEYVRDSIFVSDPKRINAQREMIRSLVQDKVYENMDVKSKEYNSVIKDILYIIPTFYGELPTVLLKDAIATISKKYKEADSWYFSNAVQYPLVGACNEVLLKNGENEYDWILTDENIPDEQLDFLCWIALQVIRYADDSTMRDHGESTLNKISDKGFKKAKDYLKFGSGEISKEYTHLKSKKFEAIANDIQRVIQFKVKEEDTESYSEMLDFIINLLKQGFPSDYKIKINSKLKHHIPVSGIDKKSKTNLFFGNAATFPELWAKMAEYVRLIFDQFTYYSDASDEEAVTVGGYAVYALGTTDLNANREIVEEFLGQVDLEHDVTARYFIEEHLDDEAAKKYNW